MLSELSRRRWDLDCAGCVWRIWPRENELLRMAYAGGLLVEGDERRVEAPEWMGVCRAAAEL